MNKKLLLLLLVICFRSEFAAASNIEPAHIESNLSTLDDTIAKLEQNVFGAISHGKPSVDRLETLETKVFGSVQSGSLANRITSLQERASQPAISTKTSSVPTPKHILKGEVDSAELAQFGIELGQRKKDASHTETFVKGISRGSSAERWGILFGDTVLAVQTNQAKTSIEIERGGKVYTAELSKERAPETSSNNAAKLQMGASKNMQPSPVGEFAGHIKQIKNRVREGQYGLLTVYDDGGDIATEFHVSSEGLLVGSFSQYSGKGTMDNAVFLSATEIEFDTHDWTGDLSRSYYIFSPDFSSFMCFWAPITVHLRHGLMPLLNPSPTPEEIKKIGFTEDGIRQK